MTTNLFANNSSARKQQISTTQPTGNEGKLTIQPEEEKNPFAPAKSEPANKASVRASL